MNRADLISQCSQHLKAATVCEKDTDPYHAAKHLQLLLDLLLEELIDDPPAALQLPAKTFNPEQVLADIALAIKHRTISYGTRWNIAFYYNRITCVPIEVDIPQQIILGEFTERMVEKGFSTIYWNQLKTNVIKLYKELNK